MDELKLRERPRNLREDNRVYVKGLDLLFFSQGEVIQGGKKEV